jgi:hypothetical protein
MPETASATSTRSILYTIKFSKADLNPMGQGKSSVTGGSMPGRLLNLPTRETLLNKTFVISTPVVQKQILDPKDVEESKEEFTVTGQLHSLANPALDQEAELAIFKNNNTHKKISDTHYEFKFANCNFAPRSVFRPSQGKPESKSKLIKTHLSSLTAEHRGREAKWHYNADKNAAWLFCSNEDELKEVQQYLASGDITAKIGKPKANELPFVIIHNVDMDKIKNLALRSFERPRPG